MFCWLFIFKNFRIPRKKTKQIICLFKFLWFVNYLTLVYNSLNSFMYLYTEIVLIADDDISALFEKENLRSGLTMNRFGLKTASKPALKFTASAMVKDVKDEFDHRPIVWYHERRTAAFFSQKNIFGDDKSLGISNFMKIM